MMGKINIKKEGQIYTVTNIPNAIRTWLGEKPTVRKYKELVDQTYKNAPNVLVFLDDTGDLIGPFHEITKILENFKRSSIFW